MLILTLSYRCLNWLHVHVEFVKKTARVSSTVLAVQTHAIVEIVRMMLQMITEQTQRAKWIVILNLTIALMKMITK